MLALGREIVERLKRIDGKVVVVLMVNRLDALDIEVLLVVIASEGGSAEGILFLGVRGAIVNQYSL